MKTFVFAYILVYSRFCFQCAIENRIEWDIIYNCSKSDLGDDILADYGDRSDLVSKVKFVPLVVFNDVYNTTLDNEGCADLVGTSCKLLKDMPPPCLQLTERNNHNTI